MSVCNERPETLKYRYIIPNGTREYIFKEMPEKSKYCIFNKFSFIIIDARSKAAVQVSMISGKRREAEANFISVLNNSSMGKN